MKKGRKMKIKHTNTKTDLVFKWSGCKSAHKGAGHSLNRHHKAICRDCFSALNMNDLKRKTVTYETRQTVDLQCAFPLRREIHQDEGKRKAEAMGIPKTCINSVNCWPPFLSQKEVSTIGPDHNRCLVVICFPKLREA